MVRRTYGVKDEYTSRNNKKKTLANTKVDRVNQIVAD